METVSGKYVIMINKSRCVCWWGRQKHGINRIMFHLERRRTERVILGMGEV